MDGPSSEDQVVQAWNRHRPYLVDLAFRMLGDIGAAEDAVQDAFGRLIREGLSEIEDERGWLIVVTSRLCLDQIRSARSRRERPHDSADIEAVAPHPAAVLASRGSVDPADQVTLDDSIRLALLVVLQRLTPAERVVFVLHDVFQMPFDEIAVTVGRSAQACRQLATRARHKTADASAPGRPDVGAAEHRRVTEKFIAACATGDLAGLTAVLAPDAWGYVDLGAGSARRPPTVGSARVARNLLRYWAGATFASLPVNGQPAVLAFTGRRLDGLLVFTVDGELITSVLVIGDPRKLGFLRSQLAPAE